jgi:hypothetical protein
MLQAKVAMNILGRIVWRKGTVFMDLWKGMRFTPMLVLRGQHAGHEPWKDHVSCRVKER